MHHLFFTTNTQLQQIHRYPSKKEHKQKYRYLCVSDICQLTFMSLKNEHCACVRDCFVVVVLHGMVRCLLSSFSVARASKLACGQVRPALRQECVWGKTFRNMIKNKRHNCTPNATVENIVNMVKTPTKTRPLWKGVCFAKMFTRCACDPMVLTRRERRSDEYPRKVEGAHSFVAINKHERKTQPSSKGQLTFVKKEGPKLSNDKFLRLLMWPKVKHLHNFFLDQDAQNLRTFRNTFMNALLERRQNHLRDFLFHHKHHETHNLFSAIFLIAFMWRDRHNSHDFLHHLRHWDIHSLRRDSFYKASHAQLPRRQNNLDMTHIVERTMRVSPRSFSFVSVSFFLLLSSLQHSILRSSLSTFMSQCLSSSLCMCGCRARIPTAFLYAFRLQFP